MKKTIFALACAAAILPGVAQATSYEDIASLDFSVSAPGATTSFLLSWTDLLLSRTNNKDQVLFKEDDGMYSLTLTGGHNNVIFKLSDFLDTTSGSAGIYSYTSSSSLAAGDYTLTFAGRWNAAEIWNATNSPSVSITAVPEPENYAMFLAGLGLIGAMVRRKSV